MRWPLRIVLFAALLYGVAVVGMVLAQRALMYFPDRSEETPAENDLADTRALRLTTADGERIVAWFRAPADDRPMFLYCHGNGGNLADRAELFRRLTEDGSGLLAIDWRGYGGSTGRPTEAGLLRDGEAAYRELATLGISDARVVIIGESLGTGVAVAVARNRPVRGLVLDSSYSSAADLAQASYPWLPVRPLMLDTFDSLSRIAAVRAPKLFLQGERDPITPVAFARRLYDRAAQPKSFVVLPGRGHVVLGDPEALARMRSWLALLAQRPPN